MFAQLALSLLLIVAGGVYGFHYPILRPLKSSLGINIGINSFEQFVVSMGIFLVAHYLLRMFLPSSYLGMSADRVLQNTIVHSVIVSVAYWMAKRAGKTGTLAEDYSVQYLQIFFFSRIMYSLSIMLGGLMKMESLNTPFFGLGLGAQFGIIGLVFGMQVKRLLFGF